MKLKILAIFVLVVFQSSCSSNDDSTIINDSITVGEMEQEDITSVMGDFINSAHPTSGVATVNEERTELKLTNFKSDDGPILELYLATGLDVNDYITLGKLKGLDGDYTYLLPNNTDITKYKYAVVWCVDFSVNFGYAVLE
ncbi:DM13 domain-containing protein [Formosa undariae]|uniref:DM13 domain-containing protein n=1 Tax=Formosa undariae TaxID=1325436 RepID=A0ABV5EYZ6_9FLAO